MAYDHDEYLNNKREKNREKFDNREYIKFQNPEILEKAGYIVENIDDFWRIEVRDKDTGEKLKLSYVENDFVEFEGKNGKNIRISTYGRVAFALPNGVYCNVYHYKNEGSSKYDIEYNFLYSNLSFRVNYLSNPYGDGKNKYIAMIKGDVLRDNIYFTQFIDHLNVVDPYLGYAYNDLSERYTIPNEDANVDKIEDVFRRFFTLPMVKEKMDSTTLDFYLYCVRIYAKDFLEYRYTDEAIESLTKSLEEDKKKIEQLLQGRIDELDGLIGSISGEKNRGAK